MNVKFNREWVIHCCTLYISLQPGGEGKALWVDDEPVPYIAPGMMKGKELVVDEWEVSIHSILPQVI